MADQAVLENDASITAVATVAGQTVFDFDFLVYEAAHVRAVHTGSDGVETLLENVVDFAVSGLAQENGGSIDITASGIVTEIGDEILIYREIPVKRPNDYSVEFRATVVNREFDTIFMILQEARRDIDRSVKAKLGEAGIEIAAGAENEIPGYDANGRLVPLTTVGAINAAAANAAQTALDRAAAEAAAADAQAALDYVNNNSDLKPTYNVGSAGVVAITQGPGAFRRRNIAEDAPDDIKVTEYITATADGSHTFRVVSNAAIGLAGGSGHGVAQNMWTWEFDDKVTIDDIRVHPLDTAVAIATLAGGGGTGGFYVTVETVGATDLLIRAINGDPDLTIEYPAASGDIYGAPHTAATINTKPAGWVASAVQGGDYTMILGNQPSPARMSAIGSVTVNKFILSEKFAGGHGDRGLILGPIKDEQLITLAIDAGEGAPFAYKNSDAAFMGWSLIDGKGIATSRLSETSKQEFLFMTGNAYVGGWSGTNADFWGVGTINAQRQLHVLAASSLVARIESAATQAEIEFKASSGILGRVGMNSSNRMAFNVNGVANVVEIVNGGGLRVLGGSFLGNYRYAAVATDPASVANGDNITITLALPGAKTTDVVNFSPVGGLTASLDMISQWCPAADQVSMKMVNRTGVAVDLPLTTFNVNAMGPV